MSLVSILIPAYNHQDYVKITLDSILNDDYKEKEIVIIDDGSTDNTDTAIKEWIDSNGHKIRVIYKSRENRGLTKTLNELISLSSGEYIVTLASDDYLIGSSLKKRVEYLELNRDKYALFSDCIVVDDSGEKIYNSGLFEYRKIDRSNLITDRGIRREFILNFALPGPILMIKRDFFRDNRAYNEDMYMEDYDLYLNLASKNMIGFLDIKVSAYRIHDSNMSRKKSNKRYIKLLEDSKESLKLHMSSFKGIDRALVYLSMLKYTLRIYLHKRVL